MSTHDCVTYTYIHKGKIVKYHVVAPNHEIAISHQRLLVDIYVNMNFPLSILTFADDQFCPDANEYPNPKGLLYIFDSSNRLLCHTYSCFDMLPTISDPDDDPFIPCFSQYEKTMILTADSQWVHNQPPYCRYTILPITNMQMIQLPQTSRFK